jgi:glutathione S-transferase
MLPKLHQIPFVFITILLIYAIKFTSFFILIITKILKKLNLYQPIHSFYKTNKEGLLITIRYSHYCEKARWALDKSGIKYKEVSTIPILHFFSSIFHSSWSSSTPVYVTEEKTPITDSSDILKYLYEKKNCKFLYPNKESKELEEYFNKEIGIKARAAAYYNLFYNDKKNTLKRKILETSKSKIEYYFTLFFFDLIIKPVISFALKISKKREEAGLKKVDEAFEKVNGLLKDGRKYLANTEEISAADITFCSLSYFLILPDETSKIIGDRSDYEHIKEYIEKLEYYRSTPAGQYVIKIYKERGLVVA